MHHPKGWRCFAIEGVNRVVVENPRPFKVGPNITGSSAYDR